MVSGSKVEAIQSKISPCAKCGKRVMCTKCIKWVHARCAKMKRETATLAKDFVCEQCTEIIKEPDRKKPFCYQIEFVKSFCYLGGKG